MAGNGVKPNVLDEKLEEVYKVFVNFVVKAPFFNVIPILYVEITKNLKSDLQKENQLDSLQLSHKLIPKCYNIKPNVIISHTSKRISKCYFNQ